MITVESTADLPSVHVVTLDREDRRNALDIAHWSQLQSIVESSVDGGARAIVLTGKGTAFSAGADLDGLSVIDMAATVESVFAAIRSAPIPVLAHINGPAVGAGAQLAVSCDLLVADPAARFRIPAAAISLTVHPGTIRRLVALAGTGAARAILLGGDWISAERAFELGMVQRTGTLDDTIAWAGEIAEFAPGVLGFLKAQLQVENPSDGAAYDQVLQELVASEDFAEARRARAERRTPRFQGR